MATLGTSSTAGTLSCTSTPDTATIAVGGNGTICIRNASASATIAQINLSTVHGASDFASLDVGETRYYVTRTRNPVLTFKTASSTATLLVDACVAPLF